MVMYQLNTIVAIIQRENIRMEYELKEKCIMLKQIVNTREPSLHKNFLGTKSQPILESEQSKENEITCNSLATQPLLIPTVVFIMVLLIKNYTSMVKATFFLTMGLNMSALLRMEAFQDSVVTLKIRNWSQKEFDRKENLSNSLKMLNRAIYRAVKIVKIVLMRINRQALNKC